MYYIMHYAMHCALFYAQYYKHGMWACSSRILTEQLIGTLLKSNMFVKLV